MYDDDHMVVKINDGLGGFIFEHRGFAELVRIDRRVRIPPGTDEYGDFDLLYSDGDGCSGWVWIGGEGTYVRYRGIEYRGEELGRLSIVLSMGRLEKLLERM